jgi:hypothetical protein
MKETDGSKRTELVKVIKRRARMNEKCGEKTDRDNEMTRNKKEKESKNVIAGKLEEGICLK